MKILGIDIGEKRIGLAISDEMGLLAHPYKTINWQGLDSFLEELQKTIQAEPISQIVIGIPYTLKGTLSQKTKEVFEIKKAMMNKFDLPIHEEDERYTTKLAEQSLINLGKKPSKKRAIIDQIAATYILQSFLDRNRNVKPLA